MKCTGISVGSRSPQDNRTLEQFVESEQGSTPLGRLLVALTKETAWSGEYTVYGSFGEKHPHLYVRHESFLPERSLAIGGTDNDLSLRGVENAVREHIKESQQGMRPAINILQSRVNELHRALDRIASDKARTAIVAAFPEANGVEQTPAVHQSGLYAFGAKTARDQLYVARELDHEFVGGIARIDCNTLYWYQLQDGVEKGQRHGLFWAQLARAFAARELDIEEKDLWCESVSAIEKPWESPQVDQYIVEKGVLRNGPVERVIVEFGPDNLPAKAYVAEPLAQAVELVDKHMTP